MIRIASILCLLSVPAFAQSAFVPFTVTEQDARDLRAYLDEQQMKVGLPILQWMDRMEQKAIKEADDAKKAAAVKEAAPEK